MSASAAMRVYIFHDCPFQTPVMSSFFRPHQPFGEVTLDDIRPYFPPSRNPADDEIDSDTHLTSTTSVESDPFESSYPTYHVEMVPSKPSFSSVIHLSSDSSSSSSAPCHNRPQFVVAGSFVPVLCLVGVAMHEKGMW